MRVQTIRFKFLIGCALTLVALSGCARDDGPTRVVVSGTVTLNGNPVEDGQIRYIPVEGTVGPVAMARGLSGFLRNTTKNRNCW